MSLSEYNRNNLHTIHTLIESLSDAIAFYSYENHDAQLELAAQSFLENETDVGTQIKTVHVMKIMQWFKGDFGGEEGVRKILRKYMDKDFSSYKIVYKDYDWTTDLKKFSNK